MIAIDQYGTVIRIEGKHPRAELIRACNIKHAEKLYRDTRDGVMHVGYAIGKQWFTLYEERRVPA